jgi:hypothetical protein
MPSTITDSTPSEQVAETPTDRLVRMLTDPGEEPITLTRAQLAYLMGSAGRWARETPEGETMHYRAGYEAGYRARVAEENASYPAPPTFQLGRWYDQADYRRRCDEQATTARLNDYTGGPVEVWN